MEKLKSIIPFEIRREIEQSNTHHLPSTTSLLHEFFTESPLFHSMVEDLTNPELGFCAKNKGAALELKNKGNACFSSTDYSLAARFYSQALRVAPFNAVDKGNNLVATLYVNRASSFHKLSLLEESLRDCNRALSISPRYTKAWYRRGKVNTSLLNYEGANCDLKVALNFEGTSGGKKQIQNDLKLTENQKNDNSSREPSGKEQLVTDELPHASLQCVCTPTKGRGMAPLSEIPPASLVHKEEPYAVIILKNFRDTHCHFCFNELPVDTVPCASCSIPLYCSEHCLFQAGGQVSRKCLTDKETDDILSGELLKYFLKVTSQSHVDTGIECFSEHGHECCGVNWPVVLPAQVVLAGRILMKLVKLKENSKDLDLSHNYVHLPPDSKVELHVFSIILLYCLYSSDRSKLELQGATFAKVIVLISQIQINSMAIVRINADFHHPLKQSGNLSLPGDNMTSNLEQVKVGQAIYLTGSLFNHSCMPNVHAYFISRTLLIRATEFVLTGCPLEMSYGPQVGQWDYGNRQKFLLENYSFKCQCSGCTRVDFPDLVLNAFRCAKRNCSGVVLDDCVVEYEKHKVYHLQETPEVHSMKHQREVDKLMHDEIKSIACLMFEHSNYWPEIQSGRCLKCGSANDLRSLHATVNEADINIRSLQEAVVSNEVYAGLLSNALNSLNDLKSTLHSYNKKLAEAEDILAEAFCSVGEMQQAIDHCKISIQILKKLYGPGHIALGNELVKLSSLQLALGDDAAADTVHQMETIFSTYYGKHAELMFPHFQQLRREVCNLSDGGRS